MTTAVPACHSEASKATGQLKLCRVVQTCEIPTEGLKKPLILHPSTTLYSVLKEKGNCIEQNGSEKETFPLGFEKLLGNE